jgi:hypothetical protein
LITINLFNEYMHPIVMKMKKLILTLLAFSVIMTMTTAASAAVIINEVELDPSSGDQWIELYNDGESNQDLTGWKLYSGEEIFEELMYTFGDVSIDAKGYYVIEDAFNSKLGLSDEIVVLKNSGNTVQDLIPQSSSELLDDTDDDARTWQRIPNGVDTNSAADWDFEFGTPGYANVGDGEGDSSAYPYYKTTITINEGWNLFSVPYMLVDDSANTLFGSKDYYVYGYYPELSGSNWKTWPYTGEAGTHDLDTIDYGHAYWVYSKESDGETFVLTGRLTEGHLNTPPSVSYYSGWNLMGPYGTTAQTRLPASGTTWGFTTGENQVVSINNGQEVRPLSVSYRLPTYGYWVYSGGSGSFIPGNYDYSGTPSPGNPTITRFTV